jgi:RNA methyltransferase, TrmH family
MHPEELEQQYHDRIQELRGAGKQHPLVKQVIALQKNTKPNPRKLCVIEGIWAHEKALQAGVNVEAFLCCPEMIHSQQAKELAATYLQKAQASYQVSAKVFARLSERDKPAGLLSLVNLQMITLEQVPLRKQNLLVILDGVEIPGNVGTIMRTMDGVQADALIVCNRRARMTHPKIIRASQGACFFVPVVEFEEGVDTVMQWLEAHQFRIYLADANEGEPYYRRQYAGRVALVAGSERYGITKQWYAHPHHKIRIPMFSDITDSLNVGIATTMILYEMGLRQRGELQRG